MLLSGKTIVVTRDANQSKSLFQKLESHGAEVYPFPTIKITKPENQNKIIENLNSIHQYDWILFTSSNAIKYFFEFYKLDISILKNINIACIGKKTAEVLKTYNLEATLIPKIQTAKGLVNEFLKLPIENKKFILPVSKIARIELENELRKNGAIVNRIEIYNNLVNFEIDGDKLFNRIQENTIDCITFYSPSALNAFVEIMGKKCIDLINAKNIPIAVIGPTTAQEAKSNNLNPVIQPRNSDSEQFIESVTQYFVKKKKEELTIS